MDYIRIHELYNSVFGKMYKKFEDPSYSPSCDIFCIYHAIDKLSKSKNKVALTFDCKTYNNPSLVFSKKKGCYVQRKAKKSICVSFTNSKLEAYKELDQLFKPYSIQLNIDLVEFSNKTDIIDIIKKWGNFRKKFDPCGDLGGEFKNNIVKNDGLEPSNYLFAKTLLRRIGFNRKKPSGAKMIQNKDVEANLLGLFMWDSINNFNNEYLKNYENNIHNFLNEIDPQNETKLNTKEAKPQLRKIQFHSVDMEYELKMISDKLFNYTPQATITEKLLNRTHNSIICPPPLQ